MLSSVACPALQYSFTLSHKWHDFRGDCGIEHKSHVLTFCLWIISHSKKNWAKYDHKCIFVFKYSTCYSQEILMKLEFSWLISKKYWSINFHENLFSGKWVVPCTCTDGQTEMMKLIVTSLCSLTHLNTTVNNGHYKYCLSLIFNRNFLADDV
jgi:hypothetical protein